jgi:antitoxin VapB
MLAVARVSNIGNSQAIHLPTAFRVDTHEVFISKNEVTGEITLCPKQKPDALHALMKQLQQLPKTAEFIPPRNDSLEVHERSLV